VLVGVYWLAVGSAASRPGGEGFHALVLLFTCVSLTGAVFAIVGDHPAIRGAGPGFAAGALAVALFAAIGPWLLNEWVRGDFDRYVWVIHQRNPCSQMGGGPGMVWVFGTSWLAAFGAFAYAALSGLGPGRIAAGLGLGGALLGATAATMFVDAAIFARMLGC